MGRSDRVLRRMSDERGSAIVEFALVSVVLIPLFMSIVSIGVFLHVRNTMSMCAHEGARAGASWNNHHSAGAAATRRCLANTVGDQWAANVTSRIDGDLVVVSVRGRFTPYGWFQGLWDPTFGVQGRSVNEPGDLGA